MTTGRWDVEAEQDALLAAEAERAEAAYERDLEAERIEVGEQRWEQEMGR